ncbi:MAG: hypothetical protein LBH94_00620 [Deltaproteobacteria bacterium]|jgi:hypothetical protein|nr:hypothetical protein [Deltaproteobacteria bacterium]
MSNILPPGETVRKAAAFVAETRKEKPARSLESILDEAGMRFNLTPLDGEALHRLFSDSARPDGDAA